MLIFLYVTTIKIKIWYLKILFQCLDIAKVNTWLMYRCHCDQRNVHKKSHLSLLKLPVPIASAFAKTQTVKNSRVIGRPSWSLIEGKTRKRNPSITLVPEAWYNEIAQWPEFREVKNKYRYRKTGTGHIYCKKCNLRLCLSNTRQCIYDFCQE